MSIEKVNQRNKIWCIQTINYYSVIEKNQIVLYVLVWKEALKDSYMCMFLKSYKNSLVEKEPKY